MLSYIMFFFFKQKTAYERRISDWSSDVCSSDLITLTRCDQGVDVLIGPVTADGLGALEAMTDFAVKHGLARLSVDRGYGAELVQIGRASCRERVSVRVGLGGRRIIKKQIKRKMYYLTVLYLY